MILDNLTRALKTQNWLAAGVEFVIVIAGVVIGFQINAWNEGRSKNEREYLALVRIQDELIQNMSELGSRIESDTQRIEGHRVLVNAATNGEVATSDEAAFERSLAQLLFFSRPPISQPSYDALEQSGELALISNADLLSELNELRSDRDWVESQQASFRSGLSEFAPYWRDYVFHQRTSSPLRTRVEVNLEALSSDPVAVSAIVETARMHAIFASYLVTYDSNLQAVCASVALETGLPCPATMEDAQS